MGALGRTVLTIGHSTHTLVEFLDLLRLHKVTAVADVRSLPYSRFNPQFNREALAGAINAEGLRYTFLGCELGGRPADLACYKDGRVCYERAKRTESFRRGLIRVIDGTKKHRIALMCAEKEPLDCHRALMVAQALAENGVEVFHVLADGHIETHSAAMERLLGRHDLAEQDFFNTRKTRIAQAVALQTLRVGARAAEENREWIGALRLDPS